MWGTRIWCCAGLRVMWNAHSPPKMVIKACLCMSWSACLTDCGRTLFNIRPCARLRTGLRARSGLIFTLPDASYTDTSIPHFTHNGTGQKLIEKIGLLKQSIAGAKQEIVVGG